MTEEEALKTWCPFARPVVGGSTAFAADGRKVMGDSPDLHIAENCIGSKCQMWRWRMHDDAAPIRRAIKECGGYCGLAGRP